MSNLWYSVAGLVLFLAMMVVARKRKFPLTAYIAATLGASSCAATLVMAAYGYYFGTFTLYFFIVIALVIGLIIDFIVQKAVPLEK